MTVQRSILLFATAVALSAAPVPARAQPPAGRDPAAADALFRAALEALDKGDWGVACAKFNASMDLDPSVSTLINIAKCHDHEGKLATAWADLNRALVMNGETAGAQRKADLDRYAKDLIAAIEPRLPRLTIVVRGRPAGLKVKRDEVEVSAAALGEALPVDPGAHDIEASAPGYRSDKRTVSLSEGKAATVELTLVAAAQGAQAGAQSGPEGQPISGRRLGAYITGGVGIAGLALGGIMGGLTLDKKGVIDKSCGPAGGFTMDPMGCSDAGLRAATDAKTLGLVSTIGFGVGAAGVVAAVVLLITEPGDAPPAPGRTQAGVLSAGPEGVTLGISGAW